MAINVAPINNARTAAHTVAFLTTLIILGLSLPVTLASGLKDVRAHESGRAAHEGRGGAKRASYRAKEKSGGHRPPLQGDDVASPEQPRPTGSVTQQASGYSARNSSAMGTCGFVGGAAGSESAGGHLEGVGFETLPRGAGAAWLNTTAETGPWR